MKYPIIGITNNLIAHQKIFHFFGAPIKFSLTAVCKKKVIMQKITAHVKKYVDRWHNRYTTIDISLSNNHGSFKRVPFAHFP